jgi:hypothetical protein
MDRRRDTFDRRRVRVIESIESLTEACNNSKAQDDISACWSSAAAWLENASDRFNEMVSDLDLVALVVMTYWSAIMVLRIDRQGCWSLTGVAKAWVLQVADKNPLLPLILDFRSF